MNTMIRSEVQNFDGVRALTAVELDEVSGARVAETIGNAVWVTLAVIDFLIYSGTGYGMLAAGYE